MNILMIYPKCPDTFWGFKRALRFLSWFFFFRIKAAFPPLGLLTVASMLPRSWDNKPVYKKLIDLNVRRLRDKDIAWADMVMLSAMIIQKDPAQDLIFRIQAIREKIKKPIIIVAGGPVFTTSRHLFTGIDHFVLGEAEITLPLFLKDLRNKVPRKVYASKERPDLSLVPIPDWSLIRLKDYSTMMVENSRGCPFNCEFCDNSARFGRKVRVRPVSRFIANVAAIRKAGWVGSLFIVDDNFIGNIPKLLRMLPVYINYQKKHNYPFRGLIQASLNLAGRSDQPDEQMDNLMKLIVEANIDQVFLGIETTDVASLKECGKLQNTKMDLVEAVKKIQRAGLRVQAGFIIGFDNDTEKSFDNCFVFLQESGIYTAMVGMLNALPGTRLWERLKKENRLLGEPIGDQVSGYVNFVPKMGLENLVAGYKKFLKKIYSPKNYYARLRVFLKNYRPASKHKRRVSFLEVAAFVHSLWRIGIFSRSNWRYDKLLFKTILLKRRSFHNVVEGAILGVHLQAVSRRVARSKA